ncbi:MAG TPA: carbon-nitrogen hydrolase family protein [Solirubrobacteraceae bacterium]|nr:carbon-nitrogen hydrolase family protein [Solirubrobacteraceae bacterium]
MRAGAIQMNAGDDFPRNLETADRLVREAASLGAELIVLPEMWSVIGPREILRAGAQALTGEAIGWARAAAAELGVDLVAGSIVERTDSAAPGAMTAEDERCTNASVHVGRDGAVRAVYRKVHLFDVEIDGMVHAESATFAGGTEIVTSTLGDAATTTLGMSICFDLRFPELYRILALRGAEILTVPSAFTLPTTRDHWEPLLRARAIENQCFVVAPNQIGEHPGGNRSGGRSLIVDPWGVVLAGAPDGESAIVADLDLDRGRAIRRRLPTLARRRPEVYGWEGGS